MLDKEHVDYSDKLWKQDFYFELIAEGECQYCFNPLSKTGHALDRIVNSLGHRCWNVVPSCGMCNSIKGGEDGLTFAEMMILSKSGALTEISNLRADQKEYQQEVRETVHSTTATRTARTGRRFKNV